MRDALSFLSELEPTDAEWFCDTGHERDVRRDDLVIEEGARGGDLMIVLEGVLEVVQAAAPSRPLSTLGPGELLGEVSFLDGAPASATVRAMEDGVLLAVPTERLEERCETDATFGMRLYRALGRVASRRLRERSFPALGRTEGAVDEAGAFPELEGILDGFKELMQRAELAARENGGAVPDAVVQEAHAAFDQACTQLERVLGDESELGEATRLELGQRVQRELHPYLLLARLVERIYSKPRGYAGDFLTIEWMYRDEPGGTGSLGPLIDRMFLERPAAHAVRNRRGLLAEEIRASITSPEANGCVTSLACGPAEEIFDVFAAIDEPERLKATLIDIDLQALALVSERRDAERLRKQVELLQGNLVYLATGRQELELPQQDLIYSIGLIDYFQDRFVVALLDWIHDRLRPGGRAILGNFRVGNPDRALMDHVLDWKLIHRSEDDMNRLFEASRFGAPCEQIRFEPACVNLFAIGVKG